MKTYHLILKRSKDKESFLTSVKASSKKIAKRRVRHTRPLYRKYKFISVRKYNKLKKKGWQLG